MRSLIPTSGSFSIPKLPVSPAAAARMHFSSASHGGTAAGLRSSSSSCASTARNARCCSPCENGSRNARCLLPSTAKSFDWPLLETRYRMSRKISVPTPRAHLDFLHPARNLWRLRLGSVRLSELERHVLGWDRGADLLSGLIPQIYFDYLRGGPPERLVPVLNHNQMDLRGLAALSSRILSLLSDAENLGQDGLELFGVSRICEKRGERQASPHALREVDCLDSAHRNRSGSTALPGKTRQARRRLRSGV